MSLAFLSPLGALAALAVLAPVAGLLLRERRHARIRATLGLLPPPRRVHAPVLAAWAVAFALVAAAAAQPVVRVERTVSQRTDAEAFVVIDITRSMLAAPSPGSPKRIERAVDAALELRGALPDVPFGIVTLTNRPLPHLFPTADRRQFELVARRAVGVNRPPGGTKQGPYSVSTDFEALEALGTENFFSASSTKRLAVLLSDGESHQYAERLLVQELQKGGVDLLVVRFWDARERVWRPDGTPEPYRPTSIDFPRLAHLAALTAGRRVFEEDELPAVAAAARAYLGEGPAVAVPAPARTLSLAPHAVGAAGVLLALLLLPGLVPARSPSRSGFAYSMVSWWRASWRTATRRSRATRAPWPRSSSGPPSWTGASSRGGD